MTRLIETQSLTIDGPGKLGRVTPQFLGSGTLLTPNNDALGEGCAIGSAYKVPSAKRLTAQTLWLSAHNAGSYAAQAAGSMLNLGKVELLYGGSLQWELRMHGSMCNTTPGGNELVSPSYTANQLFDFGDGFIVPSGTAFLVRVSPTAAYPIRWNVEAFGITGGSRDNRLGQVVTGTATTNQTLLTYTPAADWTVQGFVISASTPGHVCGQMRVAMNGLTLWESPYLGMDNTAVAPLDSDGDGVSVGYGHGVIAFPMEGVEFGEQSEIAAFAHAWAAVGQKFQVGIIGDLADVGGAAAGGVSRGRVTNA